MAKWLAVLLALLVVAAGLFYVWRHQPLQEALEAAQRQAADQSRGIAALKGRVSDLEAIRDQLQRASSELKEQVEAKEKELAALRSTQDELVDGLKKEIADKQVQVERVRDQLRVEMVDEILFDSGESVIKPAGLEVLRRVGAILKKVEGREIEVQGHTDNVPIAGQLAKRYPTNWELSAARATNVARFLQDEAKLEPTLLFAAGFSEYRPRAPNDSEEGRRRNRRIEILLGPRRVPEKPAAAR
ncbi:MAG TPA: OmpA family protein [Burkholderiales bacterium]|nr:OmpA family protein [Burkholderiales bacterium]